MKKIFAFVAVIALVLTYSSCTSCSDNSKKEPSVNMSFKNSLTSEDTLKMLNLADECMELLKNNQIDQAIGMLHEYDVEEQMVIPLSQDTEQRLRRQFSLFPVLKYERDYFSFMLEGLNDVRYTVWFAEEPNPELYGEPITKFMFNPVCKDHEWFLCVKDQDHAVDEERR